MSSIAPIRSKLAKVVAMLSSDNDGDRRNAWRALNNILSGAGCTFVDLAALIEGGKAADSQGYSEAEALQMYQSGFVDGQKSVQQQQVQHQIDWLQIADAIAQHIDDLCDRDRDLVKSVMRRLRVGLEPTEKQAPWFRDIYLKLGRRYGFSAI